jgi:thioredoxin 1
MADSNEVVHAVTSKADLEKKLEEAGDKLVVVDFYATWCGPCKRIAPLLKQIAEEKKDKLVVLKVDVDQVEELVGEYNVEVMPTFVYMKNRKPLDTLVGSNEDKLKMLIDKYLA